MRALIAGLLLVAGLVLTAPAALAYWLHEDVYSRDGFVALSKEVMRQPEVEDQIAQRTTDRIAERFFLSPNITILVKQIVAPSVPVFTASPLADQALNQLYTNFIELARSDPPQGAAAESEQLTLDLSFIVRDALQPLRTVIGDVGVDLLIGEPDPAIIAEGKDTMDRYRASSRLESLMIPLVLATITAFGLAVLVSPSRFITAALAGVALAAGSAALYVVSGDIAWQASVKETVVAPEALPAARAGFDVYSASLRDRLLTLMVAGGVIAVGAMVLRMLTSIVTPRLDE